MAFSQVKEIKEKLDILEVARGYITNFKKSGPNYFALCPFHHEKTPSFSVNPDLGLFKCFGCGESGDVITFIEKMEGVEFSKALEIAARKAGVTLKRNFTPQEKKILEEKQKILQLNSLVTEYYHFILTKHARGEKGRAYAKKRKLTKELIEKFKIGYAPRAYTNLTKFLSSKGYTLRDQINWGFVVSANGRTYDKFRSRLIFPLIDHHGDIVGFSGRTILQNTNAPKYLHSPTTLVFNKSKFLFGLEQAKKDVRKEDFTVFCEGQLDVISSHKTKVKNIVASLGTSLAPDQLELAKRYSKNIYFCFDNDTAGETALIRSTNLAHKAGLDVKAVNIPEGKDADELINTDKAKWEECVKKAEPIIDHMVRRLYKRLDLAKLDDKEEFSKIILPMIALVPKRIEQNHYLHRVSLLLNVDENILVEELGSLDEASDKLVSVENIKKVLKSPVNVKEEYLMALIFQHPQFIDSSLKTINYRHLSSPLAKEIAKKLEKYLSGTKRFSVKNFVAKLEEHEVTFVQNLLLESIDEFELESEFLKEVGSVYKFIQRNYLNSQIRKVKAEIEYAEKKDEKKKVKELIEKLMSLTDGLGKI